MDYADNGATFSETTTRFRVFTLETIVRDGELAVRLRPFQRAFDRIPVNDIVDVRVTEYKSGTYLGWHWGLRKAPGGNRVYRVQSHQGVEVERNSGATWFIGSARPDGLAEALRGMMPE